LATLTHASSSSSPITTRRWRPRAPSSDSRSRQRFASTNETNARQTRSCGVCQVDAIPTAIAPSFVQPASLDAWLIRPTTLTSPAADRTAGPVHEVITREGAQTRGQVGGAREQSLADPTIVNATRFNHSVRPMTRDPNRAASPRRDGSRRYWRRPITSSAGVRSRPSAALWSASGGTLR
jgi:hypothetical protein